jgi:hypothetical protein
MNTQIYTRNAPYPDSSTHRSAHAYCILEPNITVQKSLPSLSALKLPPRLLFREDSTSPTSYIKISTSTFNPQHKHPPQREFHAHRIPHRIWSLSTAHPNPTTARKNHPISTLPESSTSTCHEFLEPTSSPATGATRA